MKVKIANWAWIKGLSEQEKRRLVRRLTVFPRGIPDLDPNPGPIAVFAERDGWFGVPREFYSCYLNYPNAEVSYDWVEGERIDIKSHIVLRPDQQEFFDRLRDGIHDRGGIILAPPGYGKTILALSIVSELQRKTMVVVHRECLLKQWEEKIKKFTDAKVTFVYADKIDYSGDIVVGMIQSLSMKDYPKEMFRGIGVVIFDEAHHIPAPVFNRAVSKFPARWRFGLSGSLQRRDGCECIALWHLGRILGKTDVRILSPKIRKIYTGWRMIKTPTFNPRVLKRPLMIRIMIKDMRRNRLIIDELMKALRANRKVLVLSERREHLRILAEMFRVESNGRYKYDFYVGGASEETLKKANDMDVLFGTTQFAAEGVDLVPFSVVFLTTPQVRVFQSVGRILRDCPGKPQPIVTDFIDEDTLSQNLATARMTFYRQRGWL